MILGILGTLAMTLALAQPAERPLGDSERDAILDQLRVIEETVTHVRVHSSASVKSADRHGALLPCNRFKGVSAFETRSQGRFLYDFQEMTGPWVGGLAEYMTKSRVISFDGRIGVDHSRPVQEGLSLHRGLIVTERLSLGDGAGNLMSGWELSWMGFFAQSGRSFCEMVSDSSNAFKVSELLVGSIEAYRIGCTANGNRCEFVLGKSSGFPMLSARLWKGDKLSKEVIVEEYFPVTRGFAYPKRATRTRFDKSGQVSNRQEYLGTKIELDPADVNRNSFRALLPVGCFVDDKSSGLTFTVGPDDFSLQADLRKQVLEVRETLLQSGVTPPARRVSEEFRISSLQTREVVQRGEESRNADESEVLSLMVQEIPELVVDNCGLNAALFVLEHFDVQHEVMDVKDLLGLDPQANGLVSFQDLKLAFEANGLNSTGYKGAGLREAMDSARGGQVCILHTGVGDGRLAHFMVILGASDEGVTAVDPLHGSKWMSTEEFGARFGKKVSGNILVIDPAETRRFESIVLGQSVASVELGYWLERGGEYVVEIPLLNVGDRDVTVVESKGSCECFRGISPSTISAESETALSIRFDAASFGTGNQSKSVVLMFDGVEESSLALNLHAYVEPLALERKVTFVPDSFEIDLRFDDSRQELTILLPIGAQVDHVGTDDRGLDIGRTREVARSAATDSRLAYRYWIDVTDYHETSATLLVEVSGLEEGNRRITVPITIRRPSSVGTR